MHRVEATVQDLVRWIADHRVAWLTPPLQACSFLGTVEGYVLVITVVFTTWSKALAHRLTAIVLVAMSLNHVLKTLIMQPRPFVRDGTYLDRWAVWGESTRELATEFSTPSGHAMAAAAFYGYLFGRVRRPAAKALCVTAIALTGLSRPYLGVHYVEDIVLGWLLGAALALLATRHEATLTAAWRRIGQARRIGVVVAGGVGLWVFTTSLTERAADQPLAYVSYAGFLLGAVIGFPLEAQRVRLDPTRGSRLQAAARWLLAAVLVLASLEVLDVVCGPLAPERSIAGILLRYVRYAVVAATATLAAPELMVRLGLGVRRPRDTAGRLRPAASRPPTRP